MTVVVSSISKDSDYEGAQTEQEAADTENTTQNTEENTEAGTTDLHTEKEKKYLFKFPQKILTATP